MNRISIVVFAAGLAIAAGQPLADTAQREATEARMTDGKALFEAKCRTVAGEKIYRKVENVEGVLLMKVRPDRGSINTNRNPGGLPGYRWVEVIDEKDGKRYRYTIVYKPRPTSKIGYIDAILDKTPSAGSTPRYGVTYEDHVIPEERYLGVASSTVKVLDLKTNEVMGELIRYAWSPGAPSHINPSPWLTAYRCPDHARGTDAATRKFVDQILIPAKEK